jgi:hypothetical protein
MKLLILIGPGIALRQGYDLCSLTSLYKIPSVACHDTEFTVSEYPEYLKIAIIR